MAHGVEHNGRRGGADRGATLVEYSLVFALVLVVSIGAFQYLKSGATAQADNQAACLSRRPPPPSCQVRAAIVPTTTTIAPTTTIPAPSTTVAGPTTTRPPGTTTTTRPTTTTTLAPTSATFTTTKVTSPGPGARATVTLRSGTAPVAGATVQVRYTAVAPGGTFETTVSCTSDATGQCSADFTAPYSDTTSIKVEVVSVQSDPPPSGTLPAAQTVTFP